MPTVFDILKSDSHQDRQCASIYGKNVSLKTSKKLIIVINFSCIPLINADDNKSAKRQRFRFFYLVNYMASRGRCQNPFSLLANK